MADPEQTFTTGMPANDAVSMEPAMGSWDCEPTVVPSSTEPKEAPEPVSAGAVESIVATGEDNGIWAAVGRLKIEAFMEEQMLAFRGHSPPPP
jgi:hypothetical protein